MNRAPACSSGRDTGIGIPPQHWERIFDRYYQVGGGTTEGAGIGLAIPGNTPTCSVGILSWIAYREKAAPSPFTCRCATEPPMQLLPARPPVPEEEPAPEAVPGASAAPRLLLIEDNPDVVRYLQAFLQKDYNLITVPSMANRVSIGV
ncbi:MAG: hypothetical protein H6573_08485 [Lewinellaceae bacterium]|nr:hypothetical protein [Lewinellaceae bacterium]